jgi:hypothetical protein
MRDRGRAALFGNREQHALRTCQSFWVRELSTSDLTDADLLVEYRDSFGRARFQHPDMPPYPPFPA